MIGHDTATLRVADGSRLEEALAPASRSLSLRSVGALTAPDPGPFTKSRIFIPGKTSTRYCIANAPGANATDTSSALSSSACPKTARRAS